MTRLAEILDPYRLPPATARGPRPLRSGSAYVRGVPPRTGAEALSLVHPRHAAARPGGRPPSAWLVSCALALDGRLTGTYAPVEALDAGWVGAVGFDGVTVARDRALALVEAVDDAWPATDRAPGALDTAVADVYPSWQTLRTVWQGPAGELRVHLPHGEAVAVWWP